MDPQAIPGFLGLAHQAAPARDVADNPVVAWPINHRFVLAGVAGIVSKFDMIPASPIKSVN